MKKLYNYIYLFLYIIAFWCANYSVKFLAEEEITFAVCEQSGVLKALNIIGLIITAIKVLMPVFLIITGIKSLFKAVLDEDDLKIKKSAELLIVKIIVGTFIFFIPTIMGALFSVVNGYDKTITKFTECGICLVDQNKCKSKISVAVNKENKAMMAAADERNKEREENIKNNNKNNASNNNINKPNNGSNNIESVKPSNSISYGKGCTSYVSSSSYDASIVQKILNRANSKVGVSYSKMDCSDFVSYVYSSYVADNVAAGLGKVTRNKCVRQSDVRPGDIFFTSNYNSSGNCTHCNGATLGNRCGRYNCIMHVGIVTEVKNGKVTKIVHSSGSGVHYKSPSYLYSPNGSGSSWYIGFSRPYA